jgi:hypothetical protein
MLVARFYILAAVSKLLDEIISQENLWTRNSLRLDEKPLHVHV